MNNAALKKHEIYNSIEKLDEKELNSVADFVSFLEKKNQSSEGKVIKLKGIISDYSIDMKDIRELRKNSLSHLEKELDNE